MFVQLKYQLDLNNIKELSNKSKVKLCISLPKL